MKYFKSLLVIVALFALNTISAQSITDKWTQVRNYQDLLTKTSRDAQNGNFNPLKANSETLVQYAEAIDTNKFPEYVTRTSGLSEKIQALQNETKTLNDIINSKGSNDAILKALSKVEGSFKNVLNTVNGTATSKTAAPVKAKK